MTTAIQRTVPTETNGTGEALSDSATDRVASLAAREVEVGVAISSDSVTRATLAAAREAEEEGAQAIWLIDRGVVAEDPLAPTVLPTDPFVSATAVLLATRRARIGLITDAAGISPTRLAAAAASVASLSPGRVTIALRAAGAGAPSWPESGRDVSELLTDLVEIVDCTTLDRWSRAPWTEPLPVLYVPIVVHEDPDVAAAAADNDMLRSRVAARVRNLLGPDAPDGTLVIPLVGTQHEIVEQLEEHAVGGARRFVLDNVLPTALPNEVGASERAMWGTVKLAKLKLRAIASASSVGGDDR